MLVNVSLVFNRLRVLWRNVKKLEQNKILTFLKKNNYSLGFLNLRLDLTKISVRVHAHVKEVRAWLQANVQAVTNNHKTSRP